MSEAFTLDFFLLVQKRIKEGYLSPDKRDAILSSWKYWPPKTRSSTKAHVRWFYCSFLLNNPDLIRSPWDPILADIMQAFMDLTKRPRFNSKDIAAIVDGYINKDMSIGDARKIVASYTGRTEEAVTIAHKRFGRRKAGTRRAAAK